MGKIEIYFTFEKKYILGLKLKPDHKDLLRKINIQSIYQDNCLLSFLKLHFFSSFFCPCLFVCETIPKKKY